MGFDVCRLPEDDRGGLSPRAGRWLALAAGWLVLDQLTKQAVIAGLHQPGNRVTLIPGWLTLSYTLNTGAAFGLLRDAAWARGLFILVAGAALVVIYRWREVLLRLPAPQAYGLALVAAGAAGNLSDRLFRGGTVVDFIDFHITRVGFYWPHFNVADIGVTCGMTLYVVHALLTERAALAAARDGAPAAEDAASDEPAA